MSAPVQLLCLPFAGAGASFFRPWRKLGVAGVDVHPVQLPGREWRIAEEPYLDVHEAADGLVREIAERPPPEGPVALFGHSMGAVLAFELARRLPSAGTPVARLLVSGSPGPWWMREQCVTGKNDDEFMAGVVEFAGYRHSVFDDPEMRALLLPTLRADVEMHENYRPLSGEPIPVPITALRGTEDALVAAAQTAQWAAATTGEFTSLELPGGHMYLTESGPAVLALVAAVPGSAPGGASDAPAR